MQIQGYSYYQSSLLNLQKQQNEQAAATSQSKAQNAEGSSQENESELSTQDIFRQIAQGTNVRSLSIESMSAVSFQLYDAGQISMMEHSMLSFGSGQDSQSFWDQSEDDSSDDFFDFDSGIEDAANSYTMRTEPDEDGNIDWIAEFQARLEEHQAAGDEQGASRDQQILNILEKLQAAAQGGLNVTV